MRLQVGDRVQIVTSGARATVVHRHDPQFVDVRYDEPQPTRFADGSRTTTDYSCIHVALLTPDGQAELPGLKSTDTEDRV